jgi:hypothetical protein
MAVQAGCTLFRSFPNPGSAEVMNAARLAEAATDRHEGPWEEEESMRGAGGTEGGIGRFVIGFLMMVAGGYLFLHNIAVTMGFGFGHHMFSFGGVAIPSGYVLIPFVIGVGIIFYSSGNILGWILAIASLVMLGVGVITQTRFHLRDMSAFELLTILVLLVGGVGLFLNSLRSSKSIL